MLKIHPLRIHFAATIVFWVVTLMTGTWWLLLVWFLGSMLAWWLFMMVFLRMEDHRMDQERQEWESLVRRMNEA